MAIADELATWGDDFAVSLEAAGKSSRTISVYGEGVAAFARYLDERGDVETVPDISRKHIEAWIIALRSDGYAESTVEIRYRAVKAFFRWALDVGELDTAPTNGIVAPRATDDAPVPVLSEEETAALLRACNGGEFQDRRDRAIVLVFLRTGLRLSECADLSVDDFSRERHTLLVRDGKGGKEREVALLPDADDALRAYLRARTRHSKADRPELWLGHRGPMTESGVYRAVKRRGEAAGMPELHPHRLRHTFVDWALSHGVGEHDLAHAAGWKSTQQIERYGVANQREQSIAAMRGAWAPSTPRTARRRWCPRRGRSGQEMD